MIKFGFKRLVKEKEQPLFDFPYLVVGEKPKDANRVCKFWLENARDLLKFKTTDNKLSWSFDPNGDKTFYLINVSDATEEVDPLINVNLGLDFNSKPLYEKMVKILDLQPDREYTFELVAVADIQGFPAAKLAQIPEIISPEDRDKMIGLASTDSGNVALQSII